MPIHETAYADDNSVARSICSTGSFVSKNARYAEGAVALVFFGRSEPVKNGYERLQLVPSYTGQLKIRVYEDATQIVRTVRVYRRSDGQYVTTLTSLSSGQVTISGLNPLEEYFAVAFDEAGGLVFNALVLDNLFPYAPANRSILSSAPMKLAGMVPTLFLGAGGFPDKASMTLTTYVPTVVIA